MLSFCNRSYLWIVLSFVFLLSCESENNSAQKKSTNTKTVTNSTDAYRTAAFDKTKKEGMALIPSGSFQMGSEDFQDAKPVHKVTISQDFWMDITEVTNAEFKTFVEQKGYKTIAERPLDPADFPGVPKEKLVKGSVVFSPPQQSVSLDNPLQWWEYVEDANWQQPQGPSGGDEAEPNEPVVQISYKDAQAYCKWANKRLPSEAEWEYAARGGEEHRDFYWGEEKRPNDKWMANIYQGEFPNGNTSEDGYPDVAPVKSYPANPYGLYDMEGNVWEWVHDYYRPDYFQNSPTVDPRGPDSSYDPMEPNAEKRVQKGGSFLCSDQYCVRYRAGSRGNGEISSGSNNLGFRCVADT